MQSDVENVSSQLLINLNLKLMKTIQKANQILSKVSPNNLKAFIYMVNYYYYHMF